MSDVILGAVIGLIASLLTTIVIKVIEWQREKSVRWDKDILQIATDALISAERATGRIYAWAQGEISGPPGKSRPEAVESAIDQCYYTMKSLVILFPNCAGDIQRLQAVIVDLASLTGGYRAGQSAEDQYWEQAGPLRAEAADRGARLLAAVQKRLQVKG